MKEYLIIYYCFLLCNVLEKQFTEATCIFVQFILEVHIAKFELLREPIKILFLVAGLS